MNWNLLKETISLFCKNSFWKEYYETAPSEKCKEYIEYSFYVSAGGDSEEAIEHLKVLEDELSIKDWKHLAKYAGNNPFKGKCRRKIRESEES